MQKKRRTGKQKVPQKRLTVGFEVEFFVIDKNGKVAPGADLILAKASERAGAKPHSIVKECATNLVEVGSYPSTESRNTMKDLLENVKLLLYAADECGYGIYPLGTYPGAFAPEMRRDPKYAVQTKLFGKERFRIAGRCAGYHCHFALPWGVFDSKELMLKELSNSKHEKSLVNAYNLLIALDPALAALMQSSPFYQGRYIAKDARMLVYRGSQALGYPKGLYSDFPHFGALPSYKHTGAGIIRLITHRQREWHRKFEAAGIKEKDMPEYRSILDINWSPVKVNAHGTLEQRGMDMNHLPIMLSVSVLVERILRHVYDEYLNVVPHPSARKEPFRLTGKTIYVPPESHVRNHLQRPAAYDGLKNDDIYAYCRKLVELVKKLEGEKVKWVLKPLETMLEERQTTADKVLAQAKSLGYKDTRRPLPQGIASAIALIHSKQMFQDIVLLEEMIAANEELSS